MSELKKGDLVIIMPRDDASAWMKEMYEIDPMRGTVIQVKGDRVEIEPKMGDEPFWTDAARCKLAYF